MRYPKTTMCRVFMLAGSLGATQFSSVAAAQSHEALTPLPAPTTRVVSVPGGQVDIITPSGTVQVQCDAVKVDEPKETTCPSPPPLPPMEPAVASVLPTAPVEVAPETVSESYASGVLAADGLAALALVGGVVVQSERAVGLSLATYLLGAPIVHFAHGELWRGVGSGALRIGSPMVLGLTGFMLGGGGSKHGNLVPSAVLGGLGLVGGVLAASVLDAALLANHEVKREVDVVRIVPQVNVTAAGAEAGVAGTF